MTPGPVIFIWKKQNYIENLKITKVDGQSSLQAMGITKVDPYLQMYEEDCSYKDLDEEKKCKVSCILQLRSEGRDCIRPFVFFFFDIRWVGGLAWLFS